MAWVQFILRTAAFLHILRFILVIIINNQHIHTQCTRHDSLKRHDLWAQQLSLSFNHAVLRSYSPTCFLIELADLKQVDFLNSPLHEFCSSLCFERAAGKEISFKNNSPSLEKGQKIKAWRQESCYFCIVNIKSHWDSTYNKIEKKNFCRLKSHIHKSYILFIYILSGFYLPLFYFHYSS